MSFACTARVLTSDRSEAPRAATLARGRPARTKGSPRYRGGVVDQMDAAEFSRSDGVEDWRVIWGGGWACAHFRTGSFEESVALVQAVGELAATAGHYPDVDLRPEGVTVRLFTHSPGGISSHDVELAGQISLAARECHATADPVSVQHVQVAIDALDIPLVRPFWRAVLGYEEVDDADLLDPLRRGPTFWFQQMEAPRTQRGRIHVDVYIARDRAEVRIAAALAAGGHLVSDAHAPEWWTLADAEGNEADIAVWG
jgi:4a-hydroxytetrahydrobiopterin dehydratase